MPTSTLKRAIVSPSSGIVNEPGYEYSLFTTTDLNPATSVPAQAAQQGDVILWAGFTRGIGFSGFPAMLSAATAYPNIKYAYVYDEVFWNGTAIQIGLDEAAILNAADQTHAAGLQTVITILPDVILDPMFALTDINKYDVICVDVYPLIRPTSTVGNYAGLYPNILSNLLYSSIQRLRQLGFTGRIWYIYQAFGLHSKTEFEITSAFELQIETLNACEAMGVEGIVPFGFWLGPTEIAAEPDLFQGYGTGYEIQLRYPPVVPTPTINATFSLTNAGLLAVSNATPTGPAIQIVKFRLGSNADQIPSPSDTGLVGSTVYEGIPASFSFYDEQTVQINMEVPATVGPFQYGELGLYLPGDVMFARFSYGQIQIKTASPTGAIANVLRINALMRIAPGSSTFHILPGTAQTVVELANLSLVNTPNYYPENPVVIVHEPTDFQESVFLYRHESTLWNPANYTRIASALITAAPDVYHLTADYFSTLVIPPSSLGRFIIQTAGGFLRTITSIAGNTATLAQQMDTSPLVGQLVAVYELDTGAFADLYQRVVQLQATTANANLYLGLAEFTPGTVIPPSPSYYVVSPTSTSCPDVFAVTFDQPSVAGMYMVVGSGGSTPADGPLLDANGSPIQIGLISANETRTVIHAGGNFYVQDSPGAAVTGVTSVNTRTGDVVLTAADVGLPNVNNTSDVDKPVSTLQQTAIDWAKAQAISTAAADATTKANAAQAASLPLTGGTLSGNLSLGGNTLNSPLLVGVRESRASSSISSGALSVDLSNSITAVSLNANITSISFVNNAASTSSCVTHHLEFTADGTSRSIVWPAGDGVSTLKVVFPNNTPPTMTSTAGKRDTIALKSVSQFLWDAYVVGQNS